MVLDAARQLIFKQRPYILVHLFQPGGMWLVICFHIKKKEELEIEKRFGE
jgi:hypothetical protein